MTKPRKSQPKPAPAASPKARNSTPAPALTAATDGAAGPLTPRESRRLLRVSRFLLMVRDPAFFQTAAQHGYTAAEHEEGWALFRRASGEGQAMRAASTPGAAPRSLFLDQELQSLDAFENLWFPRVRAVIERVVPAEHRAAFLATFFHELTQQPLGPGVILSVRALVDRLLALPASGLPGAAAVRDTLRARGLTDDVLTAMRARVVALQAAPAVASAPASPAAEEAPDHGPRRAAYEALSAWFNDWGTTLRSVFNKRELVLLGLRAPTRKGAASEDEGGDDDGAPAEG